MSNKSKSKKSRSLGLLAVYLSMCTIMILALFLPAFQFTASSGILDSSTTESWSLLQVLQNSTEGNAYVTSILGMIATILAGLMIISGLLSFLIRGRKMHFINLALSMLCTLIVIIATIFAFTVLNSNDFGVFINTAVTLHVAIFCYIVASVIANICALQKKF